MNRLFVENIKKYTYYPYELIVIDNNSGDGSREFFKETGARVIENDGNYSYPFCQNQGIKAARYDFMAFLNNDIIVSPQWDKKLLETMKENNLEIITPCGIERLENKFVTRLYKRKWKIIKNTIGLFGFSYNMLRFMHKVMYVNWEEFCGKRFDAFGKTLIEGFVGNCVVMTRNAINKVGVWDERIQAADFDLYLRSKKRSIETGDIRPVHIALGVFVHHYIRLTVKSGSPSFKDRNIAIPLNEKWGECDIKKYCENVIKL